MRIYRMANKNKKEAKFTDLFKTKVDKFEKSAIRFVEDYLQKKEKLPTVGDVILYMMQDKSLNDPVNQDYLKIVASSVLASMSNALK